MLPCTPRLHLEAMHVLGCACGWPAALLLSKGGLGASRERGPGLALGVESQNCAQDWPGEIGAGVGPRSVWARECVRTHRALSRARQRGINAEVRRGVVKFLFQ